MREEDKYMELSAIELFAGVGGFRVALNHIKEFDVSKLRASLKTNVLIDFLKNILLYVCKVLIFETLCKSMCQIKWRQKSFCCKRLEG